MPAPDEPPGAGALDLADDGAHAAAGQTAADATTGSSVLAGGAWSALALVLPQLLVLVTSAAAARYLGPTLMGRQSFIAFVELTVIALATLGIPVALMRTVAAAMGEGRAAQTRGLLRWAWQVMGGFAVLGGLVVASGAVVSDTDRTAWLLAGLVTTIGVLQTVPSAVLIGLQRWRQAATAGLVTGVVSAVALLALLAAGGGLTTIFALEAVATGVNLVWTGVLGTRALAQVAPDTAPPGPLRRETLRFARPNALLALLDIVVWKRSEFFFLARYSPSSEIAQYSIAFAAVNALAQLPGAMTGIASSFATLHGAGEQERVRRGFGRGCRLLLTVSLALAAGMAALGPALVGTVYGGEYDRAADVLLVLLIAFPLLPLGTLSDALLVGRGEMRWPLRAVGAAVPVNLLLAALLVPEHGAVGAACANVTGQLVASVPVVWHAFRTAGVRLRDLDPVRTTCAVSAAVCAGVLARTADTAVGGWAGLFVGAAVFAVVWVALAAGLRVLSREDGAWLADVLGGRLGDRGRRAVLLVSVR